METVGSHSRVLGYMELLVTSWSVGLHDGSVGLHVEVLGYMVRSGGLHGGVLDYMVECWVTWWGVGLHGREC